MAARRLPWQEGVHPATGTSCAGLYVAHSRSSHEQLLGLQLKTEPPTGMYVQC